MNALLRTAGASLCALTQLAYAAPVCSKASPPHTVALLELYTSEGCSSCPPADRHVSGLYSQTGLTPDQVVPLSLHVDYWDYIGWKDRFAKPLFTQRQQWLSDLASSRTVYTPEVFVAGKELRNWSGGLEAAVKRINQQPAQADISVALDQPSGGKINVELKASSKQSGQLYYALVENSLVSEVKAGENQGVSLHHDYVARVWGEPLPVGANGTINEKRQLSLPADAMARNLALTAFVQNAKGQVLQALSLPLLPACAVR
jgi:hypothetical protein